MAIDISHLPSPEEIEKSNDTAPQGVDVSHLPSPDQIENSARIPEENPGIVESMARGGLQGGTLTFGDEAVAGLAAGAKTLLEPSQENKNPLEHLMENYHKSKEYEENRNKLAKSEHPLAYGASQFVGSFLPVGRAFKAAQGIGMLGKMGVGAVLGGAENYGELGQDEKFSPTNSAISAGLGALAIPATEKIVAPLASWGTNKALNSIQKNTLSKQLAATARNASEGGTLFNEPGRQLVEIENKKLSNKMGDILTDPVKKETQAMTEAFKQGESQKLLPEVEDLSKISDIETKLEKYIPGGFTKQFSRLKNGEMNPKEANDFRKQINSYVNKLWNDSNVQTNPLSIELAGQIKNSGLIDTIENLSKTAGTDIGQLNTNIHEARNLIEPFIQKANQVVENPYKYSSNSSLAEQQSGISDLFNKFLGSSGRSTKAGDKGRLAFAEAQNVLEKYKNLNPNSSIDPAQLAKEAQGQSYLTAAKDIEAGITHKMEQFGSPVSVPLKIVNEVLNPYKWAERFGTGKVLGLPILAPTKNTVRKISDKILSRDPKQMMEVANALKNNPKTKKLAEDLIKAADLNDSQKLTNATFQILQNPHAKEALGGATANPIPGVVHPKEENE